jgi:hypothetical protein
VADERNMGRARMDGARADRAARWVEKGDRGRINRIWQKSVGSLRAGNYRARSRSQARCEGDLRLRMAREREGMCVLGW